MDFHGRTAILTGGGSARGFGRCAALMLAERGCQMAITDLDEAGAKETARLCRELGVKAEGYGLDVTNQEQIEKVFHEIHETFGRIDILVNNAGITQKKTVIEMSLDEWNKIVNVDLTSVFLCCKAALPYMIEQGYGRIVNTSSVSGRNGGGVFGGAHYCAAKAGVIGFSKALGKEVATKGITVNCVAPGASNTDIGGNKYENKPHPTGVPMDRRGDAAETAAAIVFLASEHASFITGDTIDVNGGSYMV